MPKTIIFCADGTWNGPEDQTGTSASDADDIAGELTGAELTNVAKLYNKLAGTVTPESHGHVKEQEKSLQDSTGVVQIAKYLHGVGDSNRRVERILGGAFGVGVIARIVRGYTFISRHYQPGDAIHIVGFSRGAYTARALAGMITRVGLLDTTRYDISDKEEAYKRGRAAWRMSKSLTLAGKTRLMGAMNRFVDWIEMSLAKRKLKDGDLIPDVPIKSVSVWDTVGSMGMPLYLRDNRYDFFRFTDTALSDKVEHGHHAMAIDELRLDFPVTPWDTRNGIDQVWFVGAHADVGGGYKHDESHLSDVALEWMLKRLDGVEVRFGGSLLCSQLSSCLAQSIHTPWERPPFRLLSKSARKPRIEDRFHASVVERWKADTKYRPTALSFLQAELLDQLRVTH
jgi:uncharacterized protein (DUF2235 family)